MTEEELDAIEDLKLQIEQEKEELPYSEESLKNHICILNLIEKPQKENEELKDKNKTLENLLQGNLYEMYKYYRDLAGKYQGSCISKQKIKDKIEELEKQKLSVPEEIDFSAFYRIKDLKNVEIKVLQELLEGDDE